MPAIASFVRELVGDKDLVEGVDRNTAIAVGAAVQAAIINGEIKDMLVIDVTSASLGIETKDGILTKIIDRNTTIPTKRSEVFTTGEDNQPSLEIQVYQGERELAASNKRLAVFELTGIAPAPRGIPQIEVTFDIDANGIVNVTAKDLGTSRETGITVSRESLRIKPRETTVKYSPVLVSADETGYGRSVR
jgi:molecular chaperone DnaK